VHVGCAVCCPNASRTAACVEASLLSADACAFAVVCCGTQVLLPLVPQAVVVAGVGCRCWMTA
jgi:hypothetical protein